MTEHIQAETIQFITDDGWTLKGDIYTGENPQIAILISAGTGFPRRFYGPVATYLAAQGAIVMTYDYRGIGGSTVDDIATSGIDYPDWGRHDMPAALDMLQVAAPTLPLTHLAHSVGGHFLGLMHNHCKFSRHAFLSVGTGYFGAHHLKNVPTELYFWWGLGTYALARHGFIKPGGGWQGEALPPTLFRTWRRWSQRRAYFRPDYDTVLAPQHYERVISPIRSWVFSDDPIATPMAATDLLSCYPAAESEIILRSPKEIGVRRIGHEGAFRKGRDTLWNEVWKWLSEGQTTFSPDTPVINARVQQ